MAVYEKHMVDLPYESFLLSLNPSPNQPFKGIEKEL